MAGTSGARVTGDTDYDYGNAVAVDASSRVFMTGAFIGTVNFGGGNLWSQGRDDDGCPRATTTAARTSGAGRPARATLGSWRFLRTRTSLSTGHLFGTGDFGGGDLTTAGQADVFIAWYLNDGTYKWAKNYGDTGNDIAVRYRR